MATSGDVRGHGGFLASARGEGEPVRVDLAREPAVRIPPILIEPATRRVAHDDGREEILEPRVMQVLVVLLHADGRIVSRDELMATCWRGVIVGDDALNRVIGRLRRLGESVAEGAFVIETIAKVGYRLKLASIDHRRAVALAAPGGPAALVAPDQPSIAVLPFRNLSGDPDKAYLADAIGEELVTALSRWRWFFVIAHLSTQKFREGVDDLAAIGRELGVRYLLAGGVRAAGERVRVTVQLIDAASGAHLWADRFDRPLVDLLALQDDVTEEVASAVEPAMLHGEGARIERKPPEDFNALDCFYRGSWHFNLWPTDSNTQALGLFRESVRLQPDFALGHVGIARALYGHALVGESSDPLKDLNESLASAQTALGLDPREATAWFASAGARLYLGDHAGALADARQALALNHNFAYCHYRLGQVLIYAGLPDAALAPLERSLSLSPCDPQLRLMLETVALALYQRRDYRTAAEVAHNAGRLGGGASVVLAAALAQLGEFEQAVAALGQTSKISPSRGRPAAAPYADPAHLAHLRDGFRLARQAQNAGV